MRPSIGLEPQRKTHMDAPGKNYRPPHDKFTNALLVRRCWRAPRLSRTLGRDSPCYEQPLVFCLRDAVAAVGGLFQRAPILDGDAASYHTQNAALLKIAERRSNAGATRAQHQGKEFMGEADAVAVGAVLHHQQPTGKPFLDLVAAIGKRGIGHLCNEGVCIAQETTMQARASLDCCVELFRGNAPTVPGSLDESLVDGTIGAQQNWQARHALAAAD